MISGGAAAARNHPVKPIRIVGACRQ